MTEAQLEASEIEISMLIIKRNSLQFEAQQYTELLSRIGEAKGLTNDTTTSWDPEKITWENAEGAKGPYQRSDDVNSSDFKALLKNLKANQGNLSRDGYYYWTFKNGTTIGRKQRHTQVTAPQ